MKVSSFIRQSCIAGVLRLLFPPFSSFFLIFLFFIRLNVNIATRAPGAWTVARQARCGRTTPMVASTNDA